MRRYRVTYRFYGMLALLMCAVFAVSFLVARGRLTDAMGALAERKAARTEVADEVASLQDEFAYAQTNEYVERTARDELGLIYPGEYRYVGGQ
jgi:cell division protein FtsB